VFPHLCVLLCDVDGTGAEEGQSPVDHQPDRQRHDGIIIITIILILILILIIITIIIIIISFQGVSPPVRSAG
jgi:heme/copper-type cytochrome/quinol oxidase subunit 2